MGVNKFNIDFSNYSNGIYSYNFKTSDNKLGYLYLLTPEGIEAKRKLTMVFLQRKSEEFDKLKQEMERIDKI